MKSKNLFIYSVILFVVFCGLFFLGWHVVSRYLKSHSVEPVINPTPNQFITITGTIDPRLKGEFQVVYQTTNKECQETDNWLEGAYSPRSEIENYKINPDKKGNYSIKMMVDKFLPGGFCGWESTGIYTNFYVKKDPPFFSANWLSFFEKQNENKKNKNYSVNYQCTYDKRYSLDCIPYIKNNENTIPFSIKTMTINVHYSVFKKRINHENH